MRKITHRITLTPYEIGVADEVAHLRRADALANRVPGANNLPDNIDLLALDILGCRCELATAVYLHRRGVRLKWNHFKDRRKVRLSELPDIESPIGNIDVKGIDKNYKGLLVKRGGVSPDLYYVLVGAELHPTYEFLGWLTSNQLLQVPISEPRPGRPAHLAKQGTTENCDDLPHMRVT